MVFIFCSTGLFTFSSEPRTSWCLFFAVRGYLRSQANLVPHGVHFLQYGVIYVLKQTSYLVVFIFLQYGVIYILKRTSYLSGADYVMLCIVHEKMMQCV